LSDVIIPLSFKSNDPDDEHDIEVNRMHALLHPECYSRLVEGLRLDQTDQRLEIPRFNMSNNMDNENRPGPDRRNPPDLDDADLQAIRDSLAEDAASRKRAFAGLMRVLVDGTERARWDPAAASSVRFSVEADEELIEVRRDYEGREVLLASCLLALDEAGQAIKPSGASVTLEGGQKFSFVVSPSEQNSGETSGAIVDIKYHETAPFRALALFMRRHGLKLSRDNDPAGAGVLKPALALMLLVLIAAATFYFFKDKTGSHTDVAQEEVREESQQPDQPPDQPSTAELNPREIVPLSGADKSNSASDPALLRRRRRRAIKPPSSAAFKSGLAQNDNDSGPPDELVTDNGPTRSPRQNSGITSLSAVKKIYVQVTGDGTADSRVRYALIEQLRSAPRFSVTQNPDEADAMIKLSVTAGGKVTTIRAKLVNPAGDVIWPLGKRDRSRKYQGSLKAALNGFAKDLLSDAKD
jgi:hypothetical protein